MEKDSELVGESVLVTVTVKELVALVVMVPEKEVDAVTATPDVEVLVEIPDPEETEVLVEIPEDPPVAVILVETPPTESDGLTETPVEREPEKLAEEVAEHIRRTRVLAKSEMTTVATPDGFWAAVARSMSEGLATFAVTGVDVGHVLKTAVVGKKIPDAADPAIVAAVPDQ